MSEPKTARKSEEESDKTEEEKMELTDVIRDKVRKALVLSLPPEELDKYIKDEWEDFFTQDKRGYQPKSGFQLLLQEEIKARVAKGLKKWMDENFTREWNGQEERLLGDMVRSLLLSLCRSCQPA